MANKLATGFLFVIILSISFDCHDVEQGGKQGWDFDTMVLDSSCTMYIEYPKGKYFLNVSTMDSCSKLKALDYLDGYQLLLEKDSQKLNAKKGIATFQTSFNLKNDTLFTNKLISITNKYFNAYSTIVKEEDFILIINVEPK